MGVRRAGVTLDLMGLGAGEIVRDLPLEDLIPAQPRIIAPRAYSSGNLRMFEGALRPRSGYAAFADTPAANPVLEMFNAQFDNNSTDFLRFDKTSVRRLSGGVWASLLTGLTGANTDWFSVNHVARAGASIGNQILFCNGVDAVYNYVGGGVAPSTVGGGLFTAARVVLGHRGRGLVMNVIESASRRYQRIWQSIVGDPLTYTGTGSGAVDLTDDPYPIVNALVIAGRVCVFKGNQFAGSVTVGTLTGSSTQPYRWDTINTNGVGLLFPRTLLAISADMAFFVGHDGFYVYDGSRGLQQVAMGVTRDILSRVNRTALGAGFAWYKAPTMELFVHLPVGNATTPNETWVLNIKEKKVYGPLSFADSLTAIATRTDTGTLQWGDLTGTWDTLGLTYPTWDSMRGTASDPVYVFGDSVGKTWQHNDTYITDGAAPITCEYTSGVIRAEGLLIPLPDGSQRALHADDVLTLQDVTLFSLNRGAWTPSVSVSTDGGVNYTAISDGTTMGGSGEGGRAQSKSWTCAIPGTWFQFKIAGDSAMTPHALRLEFSYAGSDRHYA